MILLQLLQGWLPDLSADFCQIKDGQSCFNLLANRLMSLFEALNLMDLAF